MRMINSVLFALLAGDLGNWKNFFEIDGVAQDKSWSVTLKAREPGLAKAIGSIALDGGVYVKNIAISEASGDRTRYRIFRDPDGRRRHERRRGSVVLNQRTLLGMALGSGRLLVVGAQRLSVDGVSGSRPTPISLRCCRLKSVIRCCSTPSAKWLMPRSSA